MNPKMKSTEGSRATRCMLNRVESVITMTKATRRPPNLRLLGSCPLRTKASTAAAVTRAVSGMSMN